MLRITLVTLSAAMSTVTLSAQYERDRERYSKDQQDVIEAHRAIQEATLRADIGALDRLWAPDVMFIGGDGRVWNKADRLEDIRSRNRVTSAFRLEEPSVRVYGDTAILAVAGGPRVQETVEISTAARISHGCF